MNKKNHLFAVLAAGAMMFAVTPVYAQVSQADMAKYRKNRAGATLTIKRVAPENPAAAAAAATGDNQKDEGEEKGPKRLYKSNIYEQNANLRMNEPPKLNKTKKFNFIERELSPANARTLVSQMEASGMEVPEDFIKKIEDDPQNIKEHIKELGRSYKPLTDKPQDTKEGYEDIKQKGQEQKKKAIKQVENQTGISYDAMVNESLRTFEAGNERLGLVPEKE